MTVQGSIRGAPLFPVESGLLARWAQKLGHGILDRVDEGLSEGGIEITLPDGSFRILGARGQGPVARLSLHHWRALLRMARTGSVGWYQAWENREWDSPDPVTLFEVLMQNRATLGGATRARGLPRLLLRVAHALRRNSRAGAKRNIHAHYDLGNDFYAAWLDTSMSYSSALFRSPLSSSETLEDAQQRKVDALLDRAGVGTGTSLLEIGCGWGHLARTAAARGADVTALTLSSEQRDWALAQQTDVTRAPQINLTDYRDATGAYDAIVSCEMVEAVGAAYWPDYLDAIARLLKPGGKAALQYIAIDDEIFESYAASQDFIQAYVFPGGALISESRFRTLARERGLAWRDQSEFGADYAETLRRWRVRFDTAAETGRLPPGYDERFLRLWRYYLMYCEGGFRSGGIWAAQVTLEKV